MIWQKIVKMGRAELSSRLAQEMDKRKDWIRMKLGLNWGLVRVEGKEWSGLCGGKDGREDYWKRERGEDVKKLLRQADRWCEGCGQLLGYERDDWAGVDGEMQWHRDAVHGREAKLEPWFKVPYLNFELVGDHKVIWELNRHQHWIVLARAWRMTGQDKYRRRVEQEWEDWKRSNPYPLGINYASALEVAYRAMSWLWVEDLTGWNLKGMSEALGIAGRHLDLYLSEYFAPNTHLLGEAVALYWIGEARQEWAGAEDWAKKGWRIIEEQTRRQVQSDGVYFEHSTHYHVYALELFLLARQVRVTANGPVGQEMEDVIDRMMEVVAVLSQGGIAARMGDDDGGRLFDAGKNQAEDLAGALVFGAILRGRKEWKSLGGKAPEQALWWFGAEKVACYEGWAAEDWKGKSQLLKASGWAVLVEGRSKPWQLTMDAGPMGVYGHCHADALSVQLTHEGIEWLVDPGTGSYMEADRRSYFRSTIAHNTLTIGGASQARERGPFGWEKNIGAKVEEWVEAEWGERIAGVVEWEGGWMHRRSVERSEGRYHLKDEVWRQGEGSGQLVEIRFGIGPEIEVEASAEGVTLKHGADHLRLMGGLGWGMDWQTGRYSRVYGKEEEVQTLRYQRWVEDRAEFEFFLIPGI